MCVREVWGTANEENLCVLEGQAINVRECDHALATLCAR